MPEGINFDDFTNQAEKFCLIHNCSFTGRSCPKCDAENNKDNNPDTSKHPADCECGRCRSNRWLDNNKPF